MRVSTSMMQRLAVEAMLTRQRELSDTQLQLATGRRILRPSDDPSGSAQALSLAQEVDLTEQFQRNASSAQSRLQIEEGVLVAVGDSLQRIRELAVQGLNDSLGPQDRASVGTEVRERLDELLQLANTKDGNGEYLFSGFKGHTPPVVDAGSGVFVYQGDQGQRHLQISPTRQVPVSDTGFELFMNLPHSSGGNQDVFTTVYDFAVALEANAPPDEILSDIDAVLENMFTVRAEIGSRLNAVESQEQVNEEYLLQLQGALSDIQDLDYAEAIGEFNLQLNGLQAAQQSFQRVQSLSLFNFL